MAPVQEDPINQALDLDPPVINPIRPLSLGSTPPDCCPIVHEDNPREDLHLCDIQGYIAVYTPTSEECLERGTVEVGAEVTFGTINKIVGSIGDVDRDGYFGKTDVSSFLECYNGIGTSTCLCHFDYNRDDLLDLYDVQKIQLAVGSGNNDYWTALYGNN